MTKTNGKSETMGGGVDPLRLDLQLCFALYGAGNRITRLYRPLLDPLGLPYPQYLVMLGLWEQSPRTVGELGEALGLDSGTLTPLLKRMEAAGLVSRARDPADERRVRISLTDMGEAWRAQAQDVPAAIACRRGGDLSEIVALRTAVQALNRRRDAAEASDEA